MNRFLTRLTALMLTLALLLAPLALAEDTPDGAIDEGAEYEAALQNEPKVTVSQDELAITPGLDPDWVNILLAGSDSRTGKGYSRTDAMIILSLNVRSGQVRMTSVMRDIWTPMHGRAPQKINACTVFGGPTLAMRTLNEDFRMNIEDYVLIGMQAIEAVIDLIGGVELDITSRWLTSSRWRAWGWRPIWTRSRRCGCRSRAPIPAARCRKTGCGSFSPTSTPTRRRCMISSTGLPPNSARSA